MSVFSHLPHWGAAVLARAGTDVDFSTGTAGKTFTFAVTLDASATYLAVSFDWGRNSDPGTPTATYNGVSMTLSAYTSDNVGGLLAGAGVFTLLNPAVGVSHNVVIIFTNNVDQIVARATGISGATSVLTTVTANGGGANTATLSGNLITTQQSFIIGAMAESRTSGTPSYTPGTGVTELVDSAVGSLGAFIGQRQESSSGTFAFGATCTQAHTAALAAVAIG